MVLQRSTQLRGLVIVGALVLAIMAVGCGGDTGPTRYDVSGSVTFDGQPVPMGRILFQPDTSKGNRGPAGVAEIKDGHYDTADGGKGTVGGPHVAIVSGYDGQSKPEQEMPYGRALFSDHNLPVDLPKEDATQDIEVPKGQ